ncbi:hypothetical protein [Rhizobium leguminosarum]|uniref:hypothetical protein n=1 Tax=Rhizobium leguminosarum TaxID=384 RepID=UPI003F9A6B0F
MSDLFYIGLVVAGAVTLIIEAYRNFNSTTARHPFELHPILKEVEVRNLCTTGEIIVGLAFYAFLYLVAYAVLLSSAEVYGLLAQANNALGEIGATDTEVSLNDPSINEVISFASGDYNKPIIVSALIISSLSLGAVKPIETTMRSLAHRLAGVPRGVYKVIEALRGVAYDDIMKGQPQPLTALFKAHSPEKVDEKSDVQPRSETLKLWREQILKTLCSIDCLRLATNPYSRNLYFPLYSLERLRALSDKIDTQYEDLKTAIRELPTSEPTPKNSKDGDTGTVLKRSPLENIYVLEKEYAKLASKAMTLSSNMTAYFAVLFIRNNRAVFSPRNQENEKPGETTESPDPIVEIKKQIYMPEKDEHNAFALSLFCAFILSFIFVVSIYYLWRYWVGAANPNLYASFISSERTLNTDLTRCPSEHLLICEGAIREWLRTQFGIIVKTATWDQLQTFAVTVASVVLVIVGRDVRMEEQSWRSGWTFHQFPFLRFLSMSLLSGVAASFVTALVKGAALWWDADFNLTENQIVGLFRDWGRFFALQAGSGVILAMTALTILDSHKHLSKRQTLAIAAGGGVLYYSYQWAILFISLPFPPVPPGAYFSETTRDALIYSALPCCFLLIFAFILEMSERMQDAQKRETEKERARRRAAQPEVSAVPAHPAPAVAAADKES